MNNCARTLILVRHGNTFLPDEAPRRVGAKTDLPLVETARAARAARRLEEMGLRPDRVVAAPLRRTRETADVIVRELGLDLPVQPADRFTEIDYGPDENQTEDEVRRRIGVALQAGPGQAAAVGEAALREWDSRGVPPPGWLVDVAAIRQNWRDFAAGVSPGETVLVVSSNGIIRFAPCLLAEGEAIFAARHPIKVSTGGVSVLVDVGDGWTCSLWNNQPVAAG